MLSDKTDGKHKVKSESKIYSETYHALNNKQCSGCMW